MHYHLYLLTQPVASHELQRFATLHPTYASLFIYLLILNNLSQHTRWILCLHLSSDEILDYVHTLDPRVGKVICIFISQVARRTIVSWWENQQTNHDNTTTMLEKIFSPVLGNLAIIHQSLIYADSNGTEGKCEQGNRNYKPA